MGVYLASRVFGLERWSRNFYVQIAANQHLKNREKGRYNNERYVGITRVVGIQRRE